MEIRRTKLDGFIEILSEPTVDNRGFFVRLYDEKIFRDLGLNTNWVQCSHSHTNKKYTVRGLHVSLPPSVEGKIVTAVKGKMLWVAVDVRKNSKTFGQWDSVVLSGKTQNSIYAEKGFAHGCVSLSDDCDLVIQTSTYFVPSQGTGLRWDDPELNIDWNLDGNVPFLNERDRNYQTFTEFKEKYSGVEVAEMGMPAQKVEDSLEDN